ncbi:MAG: hypothetical protein HKN73_10305 [Gemmatimonadetes bacterium]|nr:hypothetical protein [Gemmatimonadota bacterium]
MTIDGLGSKGIGAGRANGVSNADGVESARERTDETQGRQRDDRVEISTEGRRLAAGEGAATGLRLLEIRARLDRGEYHTPEMATRIAERLLPEVA